MKTTDLKIGEYFTFYFTLAEGTDGKDCALQLTELFIQSYYCEVEDIISYNNIVKVRLDLPSSFGKYYHVIE